MSKYLRKIAILVLAASIAAVTVGGTFATWSDSEVSLDNFIETCGLDLKVNGQDDGPWGSGVGPTFSITDGAPGTVYVETVEIYNAGEADGTVYIHVRDVAGCLAEQIVVWIDYQGVRVVDGETLQQLECREIELGDLYAGTVDYIVISLAANACSCTEPTKWDIEFELIGPCGFGDTERSSNSFECGGDLVGGTAYAYGGDYATCFRSIEKSDGKGYFKQWGWTNGPLSTGHYEFDIWWGAAKCDLSKGTLIGTLTVDYNGSTATIAYDLAGSGFTMDWTHVYVGSEILPRDEEGDFTVAPGQYPYIHNLADVTSDSYAITGLSGDIYVIAHAHASHIVYPT